MMAPHEYVNEAAMSTSFIAHIVVEGDSDYRILVDVLRAQARINVFAVGPSDCVIAVILEYEKRATKLPFAMLGLIDQDYRRPLGTLPATPRIVVTDLRDMECMMFDSRAYDRVVGELASPQKLKKCGDTTHSIKAKIVCIARRIGEIRFGSHKLGWALNFRFLKHEKFVDKRTFLFLEQKFLAHINGPQTGKRIVMSDLALAKKATDAETHFSVDLMLCRGHDLMALLALGLEKLWGAGRTNSISPEIVEKMFRSSYMDMFTETGTFKQIAEWISDTTRARTLGTSATA